MSNDTGDTAWLLMSTALVMIMLPGLALFYGGLVRRKNVLSTIMHSFFGLAVVSVVWVIVGFSLAIGPNEACYVPVAHVTGGAQGALALDAPKSNGAIKQIPRARALELMKPLLENDAVLKIGHNLKHDAQVLAREGIALAPLDDTMLMSFVLDAGRIGHGKDELSERYLKHTTIAYADVCGSGKSQIGFAEAPLDRARDYAAEEADVAWRFHATFKPRLVGEHLSTVYETLERPLVPILAAMERAGIAVDPIALRNLSEDFAARMVALEREIHKAAGTDFNVGSPKQLGDILAYADEVQQIDTTGVPPTASVVTRHAADRADEVRPSLDRALALANAPDPAVDAGLFKVPRVIG